MWAFFSRRFRTWLLFALVLPVAGKVLRGLGARVEPRSPRAGRALGKAGGLAARRRR
jgi:hypothetical protein